MKNIILIGMPGCGKTTFGRKLAEELGRDFYDADEVLVMSSCSRRGDDGHEIW